METKDREDESGDVEEAGGSMTVAIPPTNNDEIKHWKKYFLSKRRYCWNYIRFGNRMPASFGSPDRSERENTVVIEHMPGGVIGIDLKRRRMITRSINVDGTEDVNTAIGPFGKPEDETPAISRIDGFSLLMKEIEQSSDNPSSASFHSSVESAPLRADIDLHSSNDSIERNNDENDMISSGVSTARNEPDLTIARNPTQGNEDTTMLRLTLEIRGLHTNERSHFFRRNG